MLNWLNRQLGEHASVVGAIAVLVAVLSANLAYNFVREFGINNCDNHSSQVQREDRR